MKNIRSIIKKIRWIKEYMCFLYWRMKFIYNVTTLLPKFLKVKNSPRLKLLPDP